MDLITGWSKKIPRSIFISSGLASIYGLACLCKEIIGGKKYQGINSNAEGKVVIITGANTGIGKETAWELARRGAKVYMACRNMKKCEAAREEIVVDSENKYVYCRQCDLASLKSVREFVKLFKEEQPRLDVLINNAGVMEPPNSRTREGFEMQLGVNHMGHFLLTNLLLDRLKNSAPSRIINVTSVSYKMGKIDFEDLNRDKKYNAFDAYCQSKLANVLFTKELARKLKGTGVTVNTVYPGITDSDLTRHLSMYNSVLSKIFVYPFTWPFIRSPRQGAQTIIYLAIDNSVEKISGEYFFNYETEELTSVANDKVSTQWLWAVSEKWTKLNEAT